MPSYIVRVKPEVSDEDLQAVKNHATEQGGKIGHEYSLFKGFSVAFDDNAVTTLESHPHVEAVEADSEVKTQ